MLLVLLGLVGGSMGLYSKGDAVVDLTPANFDKQVRNINIENFFTFFNLDESLKLNFTHLLFL